MILQEKIQKKAEGFGKLASVFLEGAKFALSNQWISIDDDLPCNHNELIYGTEVSEGTETFEVFAINEYNGIWSDYMVYENGKWRWNDFEPAYWMTIPKLPKEKSKTMTREEEKREAARKYATHDVDTDETDFYGNYVKKEDFVLPEYNAFLEGCKWSDENPKSPWISVKDDLPCNHKELIRKNGFDTKRVIVIEDDSYFLDRMVFSNNEWDWAYATIPLYWFPIPKLPE